MISKPQTVLVFGECRKTFGAKGAGLLFGGGLFLLAPTPKQNKLAPRPTASAGVNIILNAKIPDAKRDVCCIENSCLSTVSQYSVSGLALGSGGDLWG